jgi:hypothetical protein
MRKIFSFCCAFALLCASAYALYMLLFTAERVKLLWVAGAGALLFLALWWLWEDFVKKESPPA